jgi:hypothetical protein
MRSLATDLSDGVKLVQLMEIMGDTTLGRFYMNPRMRVQKAENVNLALEFIKSRGVVLTNVGAEDIVDGNLKLILGMIWTLILRFTIADIRCVLQCSYSFTKRALTTFPCRGSPRNLCTTRSFLSTARRVSPPKRVCCSGASARQLRTRK